MSCFKLPATPVYKLGVFRSLTFASLLVLYFLPSVAAHGQGHEQALQRHQQVEVSFVALKFLYNAQDFGAQAEYSYAPRSWIAFGAGFSSCPTAQPLNISTAKLGSGVDYNYGTIRVGKAFHKVGIFGLVAGGDTNQKVYIGETLTSGPLHAIRHTPTFSFGARIEVPISSRLTLNYSAQDNVLLYSDIQLFNLSGPFIGGGGASHTQEARFGLGFHF